MKHEFAGFTKVFRFTFCQHVKGRGYRASLIALGALCFLIPFAIITILAAFDASDAPVPEATVLSTNANEIYVVDDAALGYDFTGLIPAAGFEAFAALNYIPSSSVADALAAADDDALVLQLTRDESGFLLTTILPDDSALTDDDAQAFEAYIGSMFQQILIEAAGLDALQFSTLTAPVWTSNETFIPEDAPIEEENAAIADEFADLREIFAYLVPYLNVMVLYFLVLIYGQGVSNSVIMEKTSKLMDTFLVAIRPPAMILGKVLAICAAAISQFALWIAALIAGLGGGCAAARLIDPDTTLAIVMIFDDLSIFSSILSPWGIVLSIFVVLAGFLLYCSLAAIGGALAGKPEDLSSTNSLFSLVLVASFFLSLYSSGFMSGTLDASNWLNYFPPSAIFTVPGLAMLGTMTPMQVLLSLALIILCALALMYLAGRIYKAMALYKGNPPKLHKVFPMLRTK